MVYCFQAKAWVDESVFALWIREVWKPWTISHDSQPSYLLMDEFQVHLMATSLNAIKDCGTAVDFICGGYTSKLKKFWTLELTSPLRVLLGMPMRTGWSPILMVQR